jgi:hypothetical protein
MRRISHGSTVPPSDETRDDVLKGLGKVAEEYFFPTETKQVKNPRFFHMFKDLAANEKCLVPQTAETLKNLSQLGQAMRDETFSAEFDSRLPAIYTYLAQFINHDINFTDVTKKEGESDFEMLGSPQLEPWTDDMIGKRVSNKRAGMLELDCLYGRMQADVLPPREKDNHDKMALGKVSPSDNRPNGKTGDDHDVVRGEKSTSLKNDRTALIGDRRNDSNLILSQFHVALLKAHNAIIDEKKCSFEEAKQILQKHYHWIILKEFLPAFVPQKIIDAVNADALYHADDGLPLEFSVGAFRFGHSMIRRVYYYNQTRQGMGLETLFTLVALSKSIHLPNPGQGFATLPESHIIQWEHFLGEKAPFMQRNKARQLRTQMVEPLYELFNDDMEDDKGEKSLAVQDLKRSYMLRIPTGQMIANKLGVAPLTADDFNRHCPAQFKVLDQCKMLECTPLSFYVLAEATANNGMLGEVGGRIVAEVLIGLIRDRPDSIIGSGWKPDLPSKQPGTFFLSDLLRLAGVFETA